MNRNTGTLTPIVERAHSDPPGHEQHFRFPPTPSSAVSPHTIEGSLQQSQKPHRLSLQVPQNVGNPVRLVTPTVLVNGEQNPTPSSGLAPSVLGADSGRDSPGNFFEDHTGHVQQTPQSTSTPMHPPTQQQVSPSYQPQSAVAALELPLIPPETLNRAIAAELIRAPLSGPRKRLRGTEAKNLASSILQQLYAKPTTGAASPAKVMSDHILGIVISSFLGMCSAVGLGAGGPMGGVRRVECVRFRVGGDGYESPIDEDDEDTGGIDASSIKESFDVYFGVSFGGLSGEWSVKGLSPTSPVEAGDQTTKNADETEGQDSTHSVDGKYWRARFREEQRKHWESQEVSKQLREKILEAVL